MNSTKPALASTSVWGALAAIAGAAAPTLLAKAGVTSDTDQQAVVAAASQAVTLAGGLLALIGRLTATKRIG